MSKRFFATTIVIALMSTAPLAVGQEAKATDEAKAPRLTLIEPIKDFGTVPKGQKLDWSFEVKNTGTSDLELLSVKPACGCTVAEFDKVIKPGQTGKLTAHVDTATFNGPIAKSVAIETNDPNAPTAQVTISAVVKPYVEAYPAGFVRFNMVQGDAEKQSVLLFTEEKEPFEIVSVTSPREWIKVEYTKAEGEDVVSKVGRPGQNQYRFDITVGGDHIGPIAEKIKIVTNSKHQPEYTLSVSGIVRPSYRVEPRNVEFGSVVAADEKATRTVIVRSNHLKTPERFEVTNVESEVPGVTANFKPTERKGEYAVTLQVGKDAQPGALSGAIVVHTNDSVNPTMTIPVSGTVTAASASAAPTTK